MIKNGYPDIPFYYQSSDSPALLILDKGAINTYYNPTYDTLLQIEEEFGLDAHEIQDLLLKMPPGSHTLMIDVEAYMKVNPLLNEG